MQDFAIHPFFFYSPCICPNKRANRMFKPFKVSKSVKLGSQCNILILIYFFGTLGKHRK